ncbi:DDE superfamily endonuclease [[Clostridium] aminophilum]|uniref:DDE superfamily endonuclease n=1 Tax=[Clostridium] aminophilum TaxID=1526 RepID=A0A1I0C9T0_9FIRM|nr:transposase [[Clostridium] aminophilum]SET16133.1 DDE superfamily endonuclease [[Clostridium] aminophilum]
MDEAIVCLITAIGSANLHAAIQVILDNHTVHTSKKIKQYLKTVPGRFVFIFTPKHGSWLNIVDRRGESKSIVWSSVLLTFEKAVELRGAIVNRPEDLGEIRDVSYIYPMLYRFGIIEAPEEMEEKMVGKRTKEMKIIRRLILRIRCNIAEGES